MIQFVLSCTEQIYSYFCIYGMNSQAHELIVIKIGILLEYFLI